MSLVNFTDRFCVIGGGPSGLAVAKNLAAASIQFDCLEREDDFGGNWYFGKPASSVYRSTHLISSKRLTEFVDYPMPEDWPPFPTHQKALEYLRNYARDFGLYQHTQFNTAVARVEPAADNPDEPGNGHWIVSLSTGEQRRYRGVVIANGHNWDPNLPTYPGHFAGMVLHSSQYKTPDVLQGKRVLVVGAGNSGCDIAVESAQHAAQTWHSTRRGYHYVPKFLRGMPIDELGERLLRWRVPLWLRRRLIARATKLALGSPQDFGLPKPDHRFLETHPIINSQMLYYVVHGDIAPRPDVAELCGDSVRFVDGTQEPIDVIVYATGFKISFPFIDNALLNWHDGCPRLFMNVFHPQYDSLFVAGLIQPDSGQWGLVDYQAQLIARFVMAVEQGSARANRFRNLKRRALPDLSAGIRYVRSPRHLLEVEHFSYRRKLQKLIAGFA